MLGRMGPFSLQRNFNLPARCGLVLGFCLCTAHAAVPVEGREVAVNLEGQRKFLDVSIAWCVERVPALKATLADARNHAEPQIRDAEGIIGEQVSAAASRYRPLLDRYVAMWNSNADHLLAALKKEKAETACPSLRDNWLEIEADVVVEDWQRFLDGNLPEEGADPPARGERT
jgi:hypothetical protein